MDPTPIVVVVPHRLGKAEATRRLKASIEEARTRDAGKMKIVEEKWDDNGVTFRVALLGLPCTGSIEIGEDRASAEVKLSWYQSHLLKPAEAFIQRQAQQIFSGP